MRIIAYTYNAACHCPNCTSQDAANGTLKREPPLRMATDEHGIAQDLVDSEGNAVGVVFDTDENDDGMCCDDCQREINDPADDGGLSPSDEDRDGGFFR